MDVSPSKTSPSDTESPVDPAAVRRKVARRILPLVFVLYIVAYLDRVNASFAASQMQEKLPGFTNKVLGWGFGIFFAGYLILEIPGALIVEHWSARRWFSRILITWGICSMCVALVRTPWQFYTVRFLLGLAEAGFFPGIVVYFTHWFRRADRSRAMAGLVLGVPISLALGSEVSGRLLQQNWLGLDGWQWVFLVEGLPAVVLGVAVLFLLTDRPWQARWLTASEREWLTNTLEAERREAALAGGDTLSQALRRPTVWLLALGIFATNTGGYALAFWMPTAVKSLLRQTHDTVAPSDEFHWIFAIYACGLAGVWLSGQLSDRSGQRKWLCVAGMILAGLCLGASAIPNQSWSMVFVWLALMSFFAFSWPSPFWVLPTLTLSASTAAVAIGFINISANLAGLLGNPAVGYLKEGGLNDQGCLMFLAKWYLLGGLIVALLRVPPPRGDATHHGDADS